MGIQGNTWEYRRIQENTGEYKRIQENTRESGRIQENTVENTSGNTREYIREYKNFTIIVHQF